MSPDGSCFLAGNAKGRLHCYALDPTAADAAAAAAAAAPSSSNSTELDQTPADVGLVVEGSRSEVTQRGSAHSDAVDCIVSGCVSRGEGEVIWLLLLHATYACFLLCRLGAR